MRFMTHSKEQIGSYHGHSDSKQKAKVHKTYTPPRLHTVITWTGEVYSDVSEHVRESG